ncbi:glycosyltransferase family 4 protein [Mycobacterium yunnanensis]|uniref:Glycosyltransferase family 4 protein n=1 Tax=Mycobacterium yunnanensis TaxID=368477 RepID=A0A9X2YM87_9MYCO|nr:glycosyltransferase family 4 protein [Mycobacterium yunnanensis]MCV7421977.1 glycosyltransferase family 4 protein [Mycobacterium yunnanensis]
MTKVAFLVSKDPKTEHGGDVELARVALRLAAESYDIRAICLSDEPPGDTTVDVVKGGLRLKRIVQHPVDKVGLLTGAIRKRRSLVHIRFDTDELVEAIEAGDDDVFFCEHNYMAESFIRSKHFGNKGFVVNTINTESQVWLATRGLLGKIEAPRLLRDELRVAKLANAVGCYEIEEAEMYRANGVPGARFMEVTLPPIEQIDISQSGQRLVFLGGRDWPPNEEAFHIALRLWPRIAEGIPNAELCIVGAKKTGSTDPVYPDRVRDLGFVDDLPAFLKTCRALMAPIRTGGGVRVKLLDSASQGLPVVGSGPAVGSLTTVLGMSTYDDDDEFVAECRRMLLDRDVAVKAGRDLYDANRTHWEQKRPQKAVEALVQAGLQPVR